MRALFASLMTLLLAAPAALADGPAGTPDEPAARRRALMSNTAGATGGMTDSGEPAPMGPSSGGSASSPVVRAEEMEAEQRAAITVTPMPYMVRKVSVLVESTPANADIEVNGVYIGSTPLQVSLKEGVHHVKISREGYLAWEKPVKAFHGLYIGAALVKESSTKRDVTLSATAQ